MLYRCPVLVLCLLVGACNLRTPEQGQFAGEAGTEPAAEGNGEPAVTTVEVPRIRANAKPERPRQPAPKPANDWSPIALTSGEAAIGCELDYAARGDGEPLASLERASIEAALDPCRERGVVRLRYQGKIGTDFTALVQRVAQVASEKSIAKRILDLDSSGGRVEDAIAVGESIGESGWTIWVREGAVCHSACVLVLAAGDNRLITGKVGIHRIVRIGSTANTRAELKQELEEVRGLIEDYLARHGVAVAIADLMMTVPNRSLRLLTDTELAQYGLAGINAVQDDLDRIRLTRKCGEDFVKRKDGFVRAFERECAQPGQELERVNACGLALRQRFGFPDPACPAESPMSEHDPRPAQA